jgi:hypothetical protein
MEVTLEEARGDWIAFQGNQAFGASEAPNKKGKLVRHKSKSKQDPMWMRQPIDSKASWVPLAPPGHTPERKATRQPRPLSPVIALQPINISSRGRSSSCRSPLSSEIFAVASSRDLPKTKVTRSLTECTQSSGSSSSSRENGPLREADKRERGRSPSVVRLKARSKSRGRSEIRIQASSPSGGKAKATSEAARAYSQTNPNSETSMGRGRSTSRSRPPVTSKNIQRVRSPSTDRNSVTSSTSRPGRTSVAGSSPRPVSRSTSRTRVAGSSPRPVSRSTSRTRVAGSSPRPRARSTSRTRVTSPRPSPTARNANLRSPRPQTGSLRPLPSQTGSLRPLPLSPAPMRIPPPSTYRTRREMKGGGSSNSIGPGIEGRSRRRSTSMDDNSAATADGNIGRKIGFNRQRTSSAASDKSEGSKKSGFLEKLFGDQVSRISSAAASSNAPVRMRPRVLLAATVYHNTASNLWITTINTNQRGVAKNSALANKYLKAFSFSTENEARESAIANAPAKMIPFSECANCFVCNGKFAVFRRASHCRNCGVCVCTSCSVTWPSKMIPDTYNLKNEANVKVCNSCNTLSLAFKQALVVGDYEEAVALYGTGNVNLRTPFPVASKKDEVMHPIHCAVEGGSHDIVRWLIDYHFCPVKLVRTGSKKAKQSPDVLIQTSRGRSVLSIAIGRLKVDILRYLVVECGVSIFEAKDLQTSLRALEASLMALPRTAEHIPRTPAGTRWDKAHFDDVSEPSSLGEDEEDTRAIDSKSVVTKGSRASRGDSVCCR